MQRKKSLLVSLEATQPSLIELTVREHVQLDRVVPFLGGRIAERHGRLIPPGTTRLALEPGELWFRTLSNAELRVIAGGVTATAREPRKDPVPQPPTLTGDPPLLGDDPDGEPPTFTLLD